MFYNWILLWMLTWLWRRTWMLVKIVAASNSFYLYFGPFLADVSTIPCHFGMQRRLFHSSEHANFLCIFNWILVLDLYNSKSSLTCHNNGFMFICFVKDNTFDSFLLNLLQPPHWKAKRVNFPQKRKQLAIQPNWQKGGRGNQFSEFWINHMQIKN